MSTAVFGKLKKHLSCQLVIALSTGFLSAPLAAFPDLAEPNDKPSKATFINIGSNEPVQYTLSGSNSESGDEDWFRFYAAPGIKYDVVLFKVGMHLDVAMELYDRDMNLLKSVDDRAQGENESFTWSPKEEGEYYLKVWERDLGSQECRTDFQYQLSIVNPQACKEGTIIGQVANALTGEKLLNIQVLVSGDNILSDNSKEDGDYRLKGFCDALHTLKVENPDFHPWSCQVLTSQDFTKVVNIPLVPITESLKVVPLTPNADSWLFKPAEKTSYRRGEQLILDLNLHGLAEGDCAAYYVGILYPDFQFFTITEKGQLENVDLNKVLDPVDPLPLSRWSSSKLTVFDQEIGTDWQLGVYTVYLLKLPAAASPTVNNVELGQLVVTQFTVTE